MVGGKWMLPLGRMAASRSLIANLPSSSLGISLV